MTETEPNIEAIYAKIRAGYMRWMRVYLGQEPLDSLGPDASVLWSSAKSRASGAVRFEKKMEGSALWQLVLYAFEESGMGKGKGFRLIPYLAFIFFLERWLRTLPGKNAKRLADLAFYYRSWDGKTLFQDRFTRANPGLESVVLLNRFGSNGEVPLEELGEIGMQPEDPEIALSPTNAWSFVSFLHPALFHPMLRAWRSSADDRKAQLPWAQWESLFGAVKIPAWVPLTVNSEAFMVGKTFSKEASLENWRKIDLRSALLGTRSFISFDFSESRLKGAMMSRAYLWWCSFAKCDLRNTVLDGAEMRICNLSGSRLNNASAGAARFIACILTRSTFDKADLRAASFDGCTIRHASFREARLNGVHFIRGSRIDKILHSDFTGSDFEKSEIDLSFVKCVFKKCRFVGASFAAGQYSLKISECDFSEADMTGVSADDPSGDRFAVQLFQSNFSNANMGRVRFHGKISFCQFSDADLHSAVFYKEVNDCNFKNTDLSGATFTRMVVERSRFEETDMSFAWLSGSTCNSCVFYKTKMELTNWEGGVFKRCFFRELAVSPQHDTNGRSFKDAMTVLSGLPYNDLNNWSES